MRKIILIIVLVLACVIKTDASVNLNQFSIQSGFLQEGKLKPSTSGATTFNVDFWFSQVGSSNNTVKATVIYREGNTDTELMTGLWRFEGDWITSGSTVWQLYSISAVLPAGKTAGKIYLKYETGTGSTLAATFYSSTSYDIYTASTNPNPDPGPRLEDAPVGVPPAFTAPEVGSVPLYEYVSGNRRRLTTVYYMSSSYPEFTYNGIVGYVFTSATTGTVPLYRFIRPSNGNYYYSINQAVPTAYISDGIACYVYANQITKTLPVYEHYLNSSHGFHRYSNTSGSFYGVRFEDVKFYVLQNEQITDYPLPEEDCAELYQYYSDTQRDHFYTTTKKNHQPNYVFERVLGYIYTVQKSGTVPLYIYYSELDNDHYYTLVKQSYNKYRYEGIVGYVYANSGLSGTVPIYEYWNLSSADHYFTTLFQTPAYYEFVATRFYMLQYNH